MGISFWVHCVKKSNYPIQHQNAKNNDTNQYNDYYDSIYDDYEVASDTKSLYGIATRYQQDDLPPICNETIVLPPLTLRTLQNQIIPYWFKYMVAL